MNVNHYMDNIIPWLSVYSLKLVAAILVFIIGRWLAKKLTLLLGALMRKNKVDETLIGFFDSIAYYTLLIVVLIAAAEQLGVNTTSLLTVLGAAGLAVGLALKDSLSNFASGVMLVLFKPFRVGDFVNAGGVSGTVEKVTIFNTIMKTPDNQRVIVPNGSITGGVITNVTANDTRRVDLVFGIGYGDDIAKAKKILTDIVTADARILTDPAPVIVVSELADSSVNFAVRPWVKTGDYWKVYWDLTEKVKMTFDAEGVSIPFPQRDVHIYNEAAPEQAA
jgi:small conductance mechanosensitive channel